METNEKEPKVAKAAVPNKEKEKVKPRVLILGVLFVAVLVVAMVMYWTQSKAEPGEVAVPTEESQTESVKEKVPPEKIKQVVTTEEYRKLLVIQTQTFRANYDDKDASYQDFLKMFVAYNEQLDSIEVPDGQEDLSHVYREMIHLYITSLRMTISAESIYLTEPEKATEMQKEIEANAAEIKKHMEYIVEHLYTEETKDLFQ